MSPHSELEDDMNELPARGKTALFFDLDGTLIDPYLGIAHSVAHAMKSLGRPFPPGYNYRAFVGGDRSHDVFAAQANGIAAAGVLWGYGSFNELQNAGCRSMFENPRELTPEAFRSGSVRAADASAR